MSSWWFTLECKRRFHFVPRFLLFIKDALACNPLVSHPTLHTSFVSFILLTEGEHDRFFVVRIGKNRGQFRLPGAW